MVLVGLWWWGWLLCIGSNGGIVMLGLMTAAIRVAVAMFSYLFNTMFCGGICSVGTGIGGSDIT